MTGEELYEKYTRIRRGTMPYTYEDSWEDLMGYEKRTWELLATEVNAQLQEAFRRGEQNDLRAAMTEHIGRRD